MTTLITSPCTSPSDRWTCSTLHSPAVRVLSLSSPTAALRALRVRLPASYRPHHDNSLSKVHTGRLETFPARWCRECAVSSLGLGPCCPRGRAHHDLLSPPWWRSPSSAWLTALRSNTRPEVQDSVGPSQYRSVWPGSSLWWAKIKKKIKINQFLRIADIHKKKRFKE